MQDQPQQILAISGGKDSTCLALSLAERGEVFEMLYTPTGDEPDELERHIERVVSMTGRVLHRRRSKLSLNELIADFEALPNHRQRWCTRILKIEPAKAFLLERPGSVLLVGLRADEETREGMWGEFCAYRYPFREWGWGIEQVYGYLDARGIVVPKRTDCHRCYGQRLSEWWQLWKDKPIVYAEAEAQEAQYGHTFRSAQRDTWPAGLKELRERFETGDVPRGIRSLPLLGEYDVDPTHAASRMCSL